VSLRRPVTAAIGGAFILACAVTAGAAATVPGRVVTAGGTRIGWTYPPQLWALLLALVVAGVVVMSHPEWARSAAAVAAIVAAQVAGNGVVMVRDWFNTNGTSGLGQYRLASVITWAAVVALAGAAAAVAAAAVVWREPADGWHGLAPARPGYVALGAAVALLLPLIWDAVQDGRGIIPLGHTALMYSLPWGAGLAAVGWLRGRAAVAAGVTVAVSAVLCVVFVVSAHLVAYYSTPPPPIGD
jgi:hypothetical protein